MKNKTFGFAVLFVLIGLCSFSRPAWTAEQKPTVMGWKDVELSPTFKYYRVEGDEGRFRQDWRAKDEFSAGFEEISGTTTDEKAKFEAYALSETDYGHTLKVKLSENESLELRGKYFRQYYDGSVEPWDATHYALPAEYADFEDDDLYADRLREVIEYRKELDDDASITVGYDLWGRFGRQRLLRGEQSTAGRRTARRSVPNRAYLDGLSHTLYSEYQRVIAKKYNFKARPSLEIYVDQQEVEMHRYANGTVSQARTFLDSPKFIDFNTAVTVDRFFTEDVYFFGGYLFNFLKNESVRSEVRPVGPNLNSTFTDPNVDNVRISNTGNLGTVILNFLGIKELRLHGSTRAEMADTNARGFGIAGPATSGNFGHKESRADIGEYWISESLGLNYKGIAKTNIDVTVDLDQRHFDYDEYFDAGSYESFNDFGAVTRFYNYNADIFYNDLKNTWRVSRRVNTHVKTDATYRLKYQHHDYDTNVDTEPVFYPGELGDITREVHEAGAGLDVWWRDSWSSSFKYQYITDNIHTELGDQVQNLDKHRLTMTLIGQPAARVTLFYSLSYESNTLDTPTEPPFNAATTWYPNPDPYDFHGDYVVYNTNVIWQADPQTKLHSRFQITNSIGTFQSVGDNALYEWSVGVSRKLCKTGSLKGEFQYFDFNDDNEVVPGFDNYHGYAVVMTYSQKI